MSNPLKSQRGFVFLPILGAVALAGAIGSAVFRNDIVDAGKSIQESAVQERTRAAEKANSGQAGPSIFDTAGSYLKQAGGWGMEMLGRAFLGETRDEKAKREGEMSALPLGASLDARLKFRENYDKERQSELDKAKEIAGVGDGVGGLGKEDLDAIAADLGLIDTGKGSNSEATAGVNKVNQKAGEVKKTEASGDAALTARLRTGVPYANLKNGEYQKLQSACSVPLKAKGTLLVCDDGKSKFDAEVGKKEGAANGIGGMGTVTGQDCAPNCGTNTDSKTRSASSQSSEKDTRTGPKGPYYLPTGNPEILLTVDSCKGPTKPAQTDFPASGAWGCVPKDDPTAKDRFQIELDTMEKAIAQLKKTDPAKAAEMEQARKEMIKKAMLITNVEGLPYDAKIKGALMDMLFKSSYEDCERTLKALEKFKPEIQLCSGCDNTTINITLDQDGKVAKTSLTLPETFGDSGGRAAYSSLETAANLAQSLELVAGVQEGGGTLSTAAELDAQNLRESVVQSGQTVSADQVSTPPSQTAAQEEQGSGQSGSAAEGQGGTVQASADQTVPADKVSLEETRKHQADQKEALDDLLQSRTASQIKADQEKSRVALDEAEKKLREADAALRKPKISDKEYQDAVKARAEAKNVIGEQKAQQKKLDADMDAQSKRYDGMVDDMIDAFSKRFEERKKKIRENKDKKLTEQQIKDAEAALDNKLKDIKAHPRAYLEAVGKRQSVSASNN